MGLVGDIGDCDGAMEGGGVSCGNGGLGGAIFLHAGKSIGYNDGVLDGSR